MFIESERSFKKYLRFLIKKEKLKILDVGCGTGLNSSKISKNNHDITGIDISENAIKEYKKKFKGHVVDITKGLPFKKNTFDLILCSEVIEHVKDTKFCLFEFNRILKKNGTLLISTPNSVFWVYRLYAILGKSLSEVQHPDHERFFSKESLVYSIKKCKFEIKLIHSRKIFFIFPIDLSFLKYFGLTREFRYNTKKFFWYLGTISKNYSNLWSDTIIIKAIKR